MHLRLAVLIATCVVLSGCVSVPCTSPALASETFMIPALDAGIELHVRNKRLATQTTFASNRILLMVHGGIVSSEAVFDLDLPGGSWMDYAARRGFDVYAVDIRGFGRSTHPAAMDQPPEANAPFVHAADAVRDISAAVDFIAKRTNVNRISLLGWSWGTSVMAGYAEQNPEKVERLVLLAPIWHPRKGRPRASAYFIYHADNRSNNIPADRLDEILPMDWFNKFRAVVLATDPTSTARIPPGIRVPSIGLKDAESWAAGQATHDPGAIRAPTLVIVGEWDVNTPPAMGQELFKKLTGAKYRLILSTFH